MYREMGEGILYAPSLNSRLENIMHVPYFEWKTFWRTLIDFNFVRWLPFTPATILRRTSTRLRRTSARRRTPLSERSNVTRVWSSKRPTQRVVHHQTTPSAAEFTTSAKSRRRRWLAKKNYFLKKYKIPKLK